MDTTRFDTLVRSLTITRSRRGALAALLSGSLGLLGFSDAATKNKKKGKGKKGKGKKDKGKCGKAHGNSVGSEAIECPKLNSCDDSVDCDPDTYCRGGQCVPGCEINSDCFSNKCEGGKCAPDCQSDLDCPHPFRCMPNGWCGAVACSTASACPPNNFCQNGFCVSGCEQDSNCAPNSYCESGQCVPGCLGHLDCQYDYRCLNGTCVPVECFTDEDCPEEGQFCLSDFTCF